MINRIHSTEMRELICLLPPSSTSTPLQSFSLKELSLQRELKHTRVSMTTSGDIFARELRGGKESHLHRDICPPGENFEGDL